MPDSKHITSERVALQTRQRFNPLRGLTPARLATILDGYERGDLRHGALLFDRLLRQDLILASVAPKRFRAPALRGYEINPVRDADARDPAVIAQREALEYCLENITCGKAHDLDFCEGFPGLIRTMMYAAAYGHATHEILWDPQPAGLTAKLIYVPLWFFERKSGELRFLREEGQHEGEALNREEWLITAMDPLMLATAVAYMFKSLPMADWLNFTEKFGIPGLLGESTAQPGSTEWDAMHAALRDFQNDWAAVVTSGSISTVAPAAGQGGEAVFRGLIEMCDKYIAAIWRGGDMSTISADTSHVYGVSAQAGEGDLLEGDDCEVLATTLNKQFVPQFLSLALGAERPLVRIRIAMPEKVDIDAETKIDTMFAQQGIEQSKSAFFIRYQRQAPEDDKDVLAGNSKSLTGNPKSQIPNPKEDEPAPGEDRGAKSQDQEPGDQEADEVIKSISLNGAQITAATKVIGDLIAGIIPEAVAAQLLEAVGLQAEKVNEMLAATKRFEPTKVTTKTPNPELSAK